jgi:acetyl-CoA C-acetyltransferase
MTSNIQSSRQAYDMAKKNPSNIDVAELHDAFSICEIIELEDLGFAKQGLGASYVKDMYDSNIKKINPRGGLIGCGHPLGATGVAQTIEIFQQLQGVAKKRQVDGAKTGLVHNMSAAATSSTVLILES